MSRKKVHLSKHGSSTNKNILLIQRNRNFLINLVARLIILEPVIALQYLYKYELRVTFSSVVSKLLCITCACFIIDKKNDEDDDENSSSLQGNLEMLNSITEKLKEQLVTDMNHGKKASFNKQKSNFVPTVEKTSNNATKAVPPIHLVKQITEEIYNNLDKRYPLHKPALNSRVTVVRARPGEEDQFLPIKHAPIQVRLNKKTGEYQIRYTDKNGVSNSSESTRFVNGSVHEDKEKRKILWQQFDEKFRNIRAGLASSMMATSTPVTTASTDEKKTRKKRRRVVKKIVRIRRRRTTTPEPLSDDVKTGKEVSEESDKHKQTVSSESKTVETDEISDIKNTKETDKKRTNALTKRMKVGRKRKITGMPVIARVEEHREKIKSKESTNISKITRIHETDSKTAISSSKEDKSTYFTSEEPVHIMTSTVSLPYFNVSTVGTSFIVTSKPVLVAALSFEPDTQKTVSYSTYLYSRYHSQVTSLAIGTATSSVATTYLPITVQHFRTTVAPETSDEFLMSSNESTERSILATKHKSMDTLQFTTHIVPSGTSNKTEEPEIHTMARRLQSSEELAKENLQTVSSLSTTKTVKDNTTIIASTPDTIAEGTKNFTSGYSIEKPLQDVMDISEQVAWFTTAPADSKTLSEVTTEIIKEPIKQTTETQPTTEQTTLRRWHLPTVVFKLYTSTNTPNVKIEKSKQSSRYEEDRSRSGWYRYQPYSSRNLGNKYRPYPPDAHPPRQFWDKQRNRYNGRYGRGRKQSPSKYTRTREQWVPEVGVKIPESANLKPAMLIVSTENTSLVEVETNTMKVKLVEEDVTPTSYEEQLKTSSFTGEEHTTFVPITKTENEKLLLAKEGLVTLPLVIKVDHSTLGSDTLFPSSSYTPEKTLEPLETYTISQTSGEKEDISLSTTTYSKFLTSLLPKEIHKHHVMEYITVPTSEANMSFPTIVSVEYKRMDTVSSLPLERHTVHAPTPLNISEHTTSHTVSEKYTTESLFQTQETEDKHYASESSTKVDVHTMWTPHTVISSTHSFTTLPTVTSEPLPTKPPVPKQVPSYKGPKLEWPVFDTKKLFTTVSPLLGALSQSTLRHQTYEIRVTSKMPKVEVSLDEHLSSTMESLHDTKKSVVTKKLYVTNQSTVSSIETTTVNPDLTTTNDEYSLLNVVPDTDLVSNEEGVLKKIFVNPFKAVKRYLKDSFESESKEKHYINYDEPNETSQYDFNAIYDEPYFDKNATNVYFTKMRFKGTYVTVRTIYRRPSNFTFPTTLPRTKKTTTQPPVTQKPAKLGFFGFIKHKAKNTFKNLANFFSGDLSDEEEEMRRMRKNVMVEEDEDDDDDDGH